MNIDLTPIEQIMRGLPGFPPALFYAVAAVMALYAVRELWGFFVKYAIGVAVIYYLVLHPTAVNAAVQFVAQLATQLNHA